MRIMKYTLVIGAALLVITCDEPQDRVLTVHPFYTDQTRTFDPAVLGVWVDGDDVYRLEFRSQADSAYSLTWNFCGAPLVFDAHLIRLGSRTFMDLYANTDSLNALFDNDSSGLNLAQYYHISRMIPLHCVYGVAVTDTSLDMAVMCGDGLRTLIQKKKIRTRYLQVNDIVVLPARSRRLQKIFTSRKVEELYTTTGGFSLRRPDIPMDSSHVHIAEAMPH